MPYVIVNPGAEYPAAMVEFLVRFQLGALAVFTDQGQYLAFHHIFGPRLGHCFLDEYLVPQWADLDQLAAAIRRDWDDDIEGIIPWDEMSILLGAELGRALGVAWNPPEVIRRFRDKFVMKQHLRDHGSMRINASEVVEDEEQALDFQRRLGRWPVVVKPSEGAGSRGVSFARSRAELDRCCVEAFRTGGGAVLLEEFIGGDEFVVNGIVDASGDLLVTDVWRYDKRDLPGLSNVYFQTLKVSRRDPAFQPLAEYAAEVIECLGLRRAPVHMELKLDAGGPCLVEVGARFGGGNHPALASELHQRSLFELAACHYLAEFPADPGDVNYETYDSFEVRIVSGVQTEELPVIHELVGVEEVAGLPSFHGFGKLYPPGMPLPVSRDIYTKSYEVYLMHPDPGQIARDARQVRQLLRYR